MEIIKCTASYLIVLKVIRSSSLSVAEVLICTSCKGKFYLK